MSLKRRLINEFSKTGTSLVGPGLNRFLKTGRRQLKGFKNEADDFLEKQVLGRVRGIENAIRRVPASGRSSRLGPTIPKGGQKVTTTRPRYDLLDDVVRQGTKGGLRGALRKVPYVTLGMAASDIKDSVDEGRPLPESIGRVAFGTGGGIIGAGVGTLGGLVTGPAAFLTGGYGAFRGYDEGTKIFDSLMAGDNILSNTLKQESQPKKQERSGPTRQEIIDEAMMRREMLRQGNGMYSQNLNLAPKQPERILVGPTPNYDLDGTPRVQPPGPTDPPNGPSVVPGTPIPTSLSTAGRPYAPGDQAGNVGATYGNGTSTMPNANPANTVLPPNAEQILQADPMQIYEQARIASQGMDKSQMDKVRDLGLAIHRQKYAGTSLYPTDNSLPGSMAAKDENNQLREIEPSQIDQRMLDIYSGATPVLDPNKFLQAQMIGRVAR